LHNWESTILSLTDTIENAIHTLNKSGMQIVLVLDNLGKLRGTITDGDVRRGLLRHIGMNALVTEVMNVNPITANISDSQKYILALMKRKDLLQIPILDSNKRVVALETLQQFFDGVVYENLVFLMAGGFGTRLYPLTNEKPKPLLTVGAKPILETILIQFIKAGFKNFFISTHYKSEMIREHFGDGSEWGVSIEYVHEKEPLGTAGALGLLPPGRADLPLLMMNGDLLTKVNFEHLLAFHQEQKGLATMCVREYDFQVPYGVIEICDQKIKSIIEKPTHNFFVNAGIYVLEPELINKVDGISYLDMPTLIEQQLEEGAQINSFPVHEYWLDIGKMEAYERANRDILE
jgi:dTDP-glucose pyrophosphorylase